MFIAYNVLSFIIRIFLHLLCGMGFIDREALWFDVVVGICPHNVLTLCAFVLLFSEEVHLIALALLLLSFILMPTAGCMFLKKPWLYRILSYPMAFLCLSAIYDFPELIIPNIIYAVCIVLIDILNTIYIKRKNHLLKAEAANEAKVISDETIDI